MIAWAAVVSARFALEASQPVGVVGKGVWQHLDRHVPVKARVGGSIHFAHAACADLGGDGIRAEDGAGGQRHVYGTGTRSFNSSNQFSTKIVPMKAALCLNYG